MRRVIDAGNDTFLLCVSSSYSHCHSFVSLIMFFLFLVCFFVQLLFLHDTSSSPCIIILSVSPHTALFHFSLSPLYCDSGPVTSFNLFLSLCLFACAKLQYPLSVLSSALVLLSFGNTSSQRCFFTRQPCLIYSMTVLGVGGQVKYYY